MTKRLMLIAMLVGLVTVAAVACGGDDDEDAAAPAAAAAEPTAAAAAAAPAAAEPAAAGTVAPPEIAATATSGEIRVADNRPATAFAVDLSRQGDVIDFTVGIREDAVLYAQTRAGIWFEPDEMTFKLGQTVNFTIMPPSDSKKSYTFTVADLGIAYNIKFGNAVSFTYVFDKAGQFRLRSFPGSEFGMIGVINVVE